jgi:hypothetical protein
MAILIAIPIAIPIAISIAIAMAIVIALSQAPPLQSAFSVALGLGHG